MEAMLARSFALAGKGWKRPLNLYFQASASPGRRSDMPQQASASPGRHLHHRPAQLENCPEEPNQQQNTCGNMFEGSFEQRFATLKSIGEERVNERELKLLLKKKPAPVCYVWCEPSPWMHISQVAEEPKSAPTVSFRPSLSSESKIELVCFVEKICGGYIRSVLLYYIYEISQHADEYWPLVMDIARRNSVRRIRKYGGSRDPYPRGQLTAAEIFHPCLQCAAILFQKADIWLLDMDQLEANLLVRQYCRHAKRENKPVAVFHNMLPNLLEHPGLENIRHPAWAIFMEDDKDDLRFKIEKAFCPPGLAEGNPCLEYIKYIILPWFGKFEVVRKKENCGKKTFLSIKELIDDYESGALHPSDLKLALEKSLNKILQPVRDHFRSSAEAKDLMEAIEEYYIAE